MPRSYIIANPIILDDAMMTWSDIGFKILDKPRTVRVLLLEETLNFTHPNNGCVQQKSTLCNWGGV